MVLPELSIIIGNEVKFVSRSNQATKLSVFIRWKNVYFSVYNFSRKRQAAKFKKNFVSERFIVYLSQINWGEKT